MSPPTDEDDDPIPPKPGEDETIVDPSRRTSPLPPGGDQPRQDTTSMASASRIIAERVEYLDENGKLVTESLRDYHQEGAHESASPASTSSCKRWNAAERKQAIIEELEAEGLPLDAIRRRGRQGPRSLRPHLPRRLRPASRSRAASAPRTSRKRDVFTKYGDAGPRRARSPAAEVPGRGRRSISTMPHVLKIAPFTRMGTPFELIKAFGGKARLREGRP